MLDLRIETGLRFIKPDQQVKYIRDQHNHVPEPNGREDLLIEQIYR